jgi:hypothetical protein
MSVRYIQLPPDSELPDLGWSSPYRAIVVVEDTVRTSWQSKVSDWLISSGCLYMLAWGIECGSWDDSVDFSVLEKIDFGDIPDVNFVMTTWHESESLIDVFQFAKYGAFHSDVELENTLILHVCSTNKKDEFLLSFDSL